MGLGFAFFFPIDSHSHFYFEKCGTHAIAFFLNWPTRYNIWFNFCFRVHLKTELNLKWVNWDVNFFWHLSNTFFRFANWTELYLHCIYYCLKKTFIFQLIMNVKYWIDALCWLELQTCIWVLSYKAYWFNSFVDEIPLQTCLTHDF